MNTEQLYSTLVHMDLEMKLDSRIRRSKWIVLTMPFIGIVFMGFILWSGYLDIVLNIELPLVQRIGIVLSLVYVLITVFYLEYSNPLRKKSQEIQLFIWIEYFIKKYEKSVDIPASQFSAKYVEYTMILNQIKKNMRQVKTHISNSYVFVDDTVLINKAFSDVTTSISKTKVDARKSIGTKNITALITILKALNELYVYHYSLKLIGHTKYDKKFSQKLRKELINSKEKLFTSISEICEQKEVEVVKSNAKRSLLEIKLINVENSFPIKLPVILAILSLIFLIFIKDSEYLGFVATYVTILNTIVAVVGKRDEDV